MEPSYVYRARCVRVIDADTFVISADLGFRVAFEFHGRLHAVNAPELATPEGKAAKAFAMTLLPPSEPIVVRSYRDVQTFARWVVDLWLADGRSLTDVLVDAGHATRA